MKQISQAMITKMKSPDANHPPIDYSMSTCYYRVTEGAKTIMASVEPLRAIGYMTKNRELWKVEL